MGQEDISLFKIADIGDSDAVVKERLTLFNSKTFIIFVSFFVINISYIFKCCTLAFFLYRFIEKMPDVIDGFSVDITNSSLVKTIS